ncbi:Uncharacterized protein GBIM_00682, partial [Gryllus bimaculatus]
MTASCNNTIIGPEERTVFLKKHGDSIDSGLETEAIERMATYVIINSRDKMKFTLTPSAVQILLDVANGFIQKTSSGPSPSFCSSDAQMSLFNELGPSSKLSVISMSETDPDGSKKVLLTATYEKSDSLPSSPASTVASAELLDVYHSDEYDDLDLE